MKKLALLLLLAAVMPGLVGCSKNKDDIIQGYWASESASQKAQTTEELSQYNYLHITPSNMNLKYYTLETQDETLVKVFTDVDENMKYEWISDNQILINDKAYEIMLKKKTMVIKNSNIEINFFKEDQTANGGEGETDEAVD